MTNDYGEVDGDTLSTDSGSITVSTTDNTATGTWWEYTTPKIIISTPGIYPTSLKDNKKGDDDMRYLYEVILVNPKNDEFFVDRFVAKTETSAIMQAYDEYSKVLDKINFDDLKTSYRVLMEWKKEKSLKKAIETIKKAVE